MLRRTILAASAVSCAFAMTSCAAEGNAPAPETQESASQETGAPDAPDPALKIEKPKDLKTVTDTCAMLKPDQLAMLGQDDKDPKSEDTVYGESRCTWFGEKYSTAVAIAASQDVSPAQLRENAKQADNFKPTEVDGYPGVLVDDQGTMCRVDLSVSDNQFIAVNYTKLGGTEPEYQNGCEFAEKIASEVLKNIPDAQPK